MPELPEVEVTRLGLAPRLTGRRVTATVARTPALRYPFPSGLEAALERKILRDIERRGKYLLFHFTDCHLLVHLGMSGSLRLVAPGVPPEKHDHFDLAFSGEILRLRDPRRFGAVLLLRGDPADHPLLKHLGAEPLSRRFSATTLRHALDGRQMGVKPAIMDAGIVVGVGNIYASESLFRAGIDPRTPAGRLSAAQATALVGSIKATLRAAIRAGGSSLRDYVGCDGGAGRYQGQHDVYGRAGEPCHRCGTPIESLRQAGRVTYHCPHCQR
jgi:formamidopyrimidine-DNA glycosylase